MLKKTTKYPYKLGYALSGGGARGFALLGVIKALEEQNIFPDIISGTSVGALLAVFYADGYSTDEILEIANSISFTSIADSTIPRGGFFKITGVRNIIKKHIKAKTFEQLKIPVKVVASDIELGQIKSFSEGDIIPAVMASCSVPIVFTPIEINGHHYVDGGLLMNFPVSVIRNEAERILGINISPVVSMKYEDSIKHIIEQSMNYMVGANTSSQRELCDYLIESEEISEYSIFDFKNKKEIYSKGYLRANEYIEENMEKLQKELFKVPPKGLRNKLADLILKLKSNPDNN